MAFGPPKAFPQTPSEKEIIAQKQNLKNFVFAQGSLLRGIKKIYKDRKRTDSFSRVSKIGRFYLRGDRFSLESAKIVSFPVKRKVFAPY